MGLGVILEAFFRAVGQIGDPRFNKVLFLGIGLTIALLAAVTVAFVWLVGWLVGGDATLFGWHIGWLDNLLGWGVVLVMLVLSVFLMVPVASAITSLFLERVAEAVEDRHYPQLPRAEPISFSEGLRDSINFLGVLILANLVALILYLIFLPLAPVIFWALNGFLLGREYFTLVAMRRLGRAGAKTLRARNAGTIWLAGGLMAIPLTIPVLNLLVPVIGAATFTHLFHTLTKDRA